MRGRRDDDDEEEGEEVGGEGVAGVKRGGVGRKRGEGRRARK